MFKDPFPQPRRPKKSNASSEKIGGEYYATLSASVNQRSPRGRLYALAGMFVLLVIALSMLKGWSTTAEAEKKTEEPSIEIGTDLKTRIRGVPALDQTIAERIVDLGPEARARWPHEAASYLLYETQYTPAVRGYARNLLPITSGSAEQIALDSRQWRFKYVSFRGKLESVREENYDDTYGPSEVGKIGQVKRGRVLIPGDPPVHVTFVTDSLMDFQDRNQIRPEIVAIEDGWVRVRGVFVKNFRDRDPGGTETSTLLIVATQVARDFERVEVNSLEDIDFDTIVDDPSLGNTADGRDILHMNFPRPMFRLLKYAEARAGAYGRALREKENLKPAEIDTPGMYEDVIGNPGKYRGKYFGGLGVIAQMGFTYGATDTRANDAGVEGYAEGYLGTDRERAIRVLIPEPLTGRTWKRNTRIRWAGYFYKSLGYPARNGTRRLAPFLILTELVEILPPKRNVKGEIYVALGALGGLGLLVWFILRDDKTSKEFRRRRPRKIEA